MEFKNLIKFYLDEHGKVEKTEDTSFIVSGSENETALEVLIAKNVYIASEAISLFLLSSFNSFIFKKPFKVKIQRSKGEDAALNLF